MRNVLPGIGGCLHGASCTYDNTVDEGLYYRYVARQARHAADHRAGAATALSLRRCWAKLPVQFAQGEASSFNLAPFSLARFNA
ncbi:hypothetical protein LNP05_13225 [Klebsiella pneumoniae subsp. pneumoniae]|nr:hypothetical protein [Klebsiella pneumoniae subsp. pneumoniae]